MRPIDEVRCQNTNAGVSDKQHGHLQLAWGDWLGSPRSAEDSHQPQTDTSLPVTVREGEIGVGAEGFRTAVDGQIRRRNISWLLFEWLPEGSAKLQCGSNQEESDQKGYQGYFLKETMLHAGQTHHQLGRFEEFGTRQTQDWVFGGNREDQRRSVQWKQLRYQKNQRLTTDWKIAVKFAGIMRFSAERKPHAWDKDHVGVHKIVLQWIVLPLDMQ